MEKEFLQWIKETPTGFQAVDNAKKMLLSKKAAELKENEKWTLKEGRTYFVTRNDTALIAFTYSAKKNGFRIYLAHGDSPCFKLKWNPEMDFERKYIRCNIEGYGGMIVSSWFDRPLGLAGRVSFSKDGRVVSENIFLNEPLFIIPNIAPHQMKVSDPNLQIDLLPLAGTSESKGKLLKKIAKAAGCKEKEILGMDLFFVNIEEGKISGLSKEFITAPRLDDLACVYSGLLGFLAALEGAYSPVFCLYCNEEVGSGNRDGASSTFLKDVLERINRISGGNEEDFQIRIANSFALSADNGHALHPNHPEKNDPTNRTFINDGILIKFAANQHYTTDGLTGSWVSQLCELNRIPYQRFFNRADERGGSTLGNISICQVPVPTADIGLPQLAMHSAYETAGVKDLKALQQLLIAFFEMQ